jgi:hypothetical protein
MFLRSLRYARFFQFQRNTSQPPNFCIGDRGQNLRYRIDIKSLIQIKHIPKNNRTIKMTETNGNGSQPTVGTVRVKQGLAQMLKGGVIVSSALYFSLKEVDHHYDGTNGTW